jgi:probable phosphoglycerate mutase
MSDLQCPATFLVVPVDTLGEGWRGAVAGLAERLRDRRVAAVYGGTTAPAVAVSAALADGLGVPSHRLAQRPTPPGDPADGHTDGSAVARWRAALQELADLHRGETVLVVDDGRVLEPALTPLVGRGPGAGLRPASYRPVTVEVDGDGWRLVDRPGPGGRGLSR